MATVKHGRRPYRSEHRQRQAARTRAAILDAARHLFIERGYGGATIEAIAEAAGVAGITVYSSFGTKREILNQLIHIAVVGDESPTPIIEREGPRAVMALTDQHEQISQFAHDIAVIMERVAPLLDVLGHAAASDQEMAERYDMILSERLRSMQTFATAVRRNGPLRDGMSTDRAGEIMWALTSAEVVLLLTRRLGWSRDQYVHWLDTTLATTVLTPV